MAQGYSAAQDSEIVPFDFPGGDIVDIRLYKGDGDKSLLGFACDEGTGQTEIPAEDVVTLINVAIASSDKQVYLISSGGGTRERHQA